MPPVSFIIAFIVAVFTIAISILVIFAYSMSDNPSQSGMDMKPLAIKVFLCGAALSGLIAASHYIHLHW